MHEHISQTIINHGKYACAECLRDAIERNEQLQRDIERAHEKLRALGVCPWCGGGNDGPHAC